MGTLLELTGVRAGYGGGDILHGVDLNIDEGSLTCIVGPNGAGKSTVLRVISGLLRPSGGTVRFRGESLAGRSPRAILARGIVHVPQERSLFATMSVWENVRLGAFTVRDRGLIDRRLKNVCEMFPLVVERRHEPAASLSGGQQKIVEFARALMLDPVLLILDEPSMGLDPKTRTLVFNTVRDMHLSGRTLLLVEQNARSGLGIASHGVVMESGRVRFEGPGPDVLNNPEIGRLYLGGGLSKYDVIFAGAGHNNLLAAAYAARAGFRVLVLEGAPRIGGDTTCEELTLPGYIHDPCATAHNLIQSNPLMRNNELALDRYGLKYIYPDPVFTMPFLDGASITMWRDLDRTCAELSRYSASDASAYRALLADWELMAPVVNAERASAPRPPDELDAQALQSPLGAEMLRIRRASAIDIIKERFREEHVRAFFAWIAFMTLHPLDEPETGLMAFSLVAGRQRFSWILPEGGSIQLPMALARIIEENGGIIATSKPITRIVVDQGRAAAVETSDGSTYRAGSAIVSTIHIKHLAGLIGKEHLPDAYRIGVERWQPNLTMFVAHYALSEAPLFKTEVGAAPSATVGALESLDSYDAMLRAYRSGKVDLQEPVFLALTPTVVDPTRAPAGRHTFKLVGFLPYELAEGPEHWDQIKADVSNELFEQLGRLSTNLSRRIVLGEHVDSPLDLERRNPANWRGSCHGGANSPEQSGYFRPVEGWSSYRTPVDGLYQNGACTHPGGSVSGLPGRNCAEVLLADLGSSLQEAIERKGVATP